MPWRLLEYTPALLCSAYLISTQKTVEDGHDPQCPVQSKETTKARRHNLEFSEDRVGRENQGRA